MSSYAAFKRSRETEESLMAKRLNAERIKEFDKSVRQFNAIYMPVVLNLPSEGCVRNVAFRPCTHKSPIISEKCVAQTPRASTQTPTIESWNKSTSNARSKKTVCINLPYINFVISRRLVTNKIRPLYFINRFHRHQQF